MRDQELHHATDYSKGQKEAAHRVLVELINLFDAYKDDIRIVGGWVPDLMFPGEGHVGSNDVDVLINHLTLQDAGYQTMAKLLLQNGYAKHPTQYFSFVKSVTVESTQYPVAVDILAGKYGGTQKQKSSQHVQGIKALKATGGNFAFTFDPQQIQIEAQRPDGAMDVAHVNVVAVVPFLVMKASALGRGKPKDAYDIYFIIKHYHGGVKQLAREFAGYSDNFHIQEMKKKLSEKFASVNHVGPVDVVEFQNIADAEGREIIQRDVYEQIQALLSML